MSSSRCHARASSEGPTTEYASSDADAVEGVERPADHVARRIFCPTAGLAAKKWPGVSASRTSETRTTSAHGGPVLDADRSPDSEGDGTAQRHAAPSSSTIMGRDEVARYDFGGAPF